MSVCNLPGAESEDGAHRHGVLDDGQTDLSEHVRQWSISVLYKTNNKVVSYHITSTYNSTKPVRVFEKPTVFYKV